MKKILCYGDSNTWGYVPGTGERYPEDVRWPCVCQKELGEEFKIMKMASMAVRPVMNRAGEMPRTVEKGCPMRCYQTIRWMELL